MAATAQDVRSVRLGGKEVLARSVEVDAGVARRCDEQEVRIGDRLVEDGARPGAAPGRVDERHAEVRRVVDRLDGLIVHAAVVDVIDELRAP